MSYSLQEIMDRNKNEDHFPFVELERRAQKVSIQEFIFSKNKVRQCFTDNNMKHE